MRVSFKALLIVGVSTPRWNLPHSAEGGGANIVQVEIIFYRLLKTLVYRLLEFVEMQADSGLVSQQMDNAIMPKPNKQTAFY